MRPQPFLLALIALVPLAHAIGGTGMPSDSVVVRPSCFGPEEDELMKQIQNQLGMAPGSTGGAVATAAPPAPPAKNAPASSNRRGGGSGGLIGLPKGKAKKAPSAAPAAGYELDGRNITESKKSGRTKRDKAEESIAFGADSEAPDDDFDGVADLGGDEGEDDRSYRDVERQTEAPVSVGRRVMDWGAKIFLSNDDSMSLASAQRTIYAVQQGLPLSVDNIRPHELLNYFSFDVATPDADQLFDVHASAVQNGDTLSVALAVQGGTPERQPLDLTMVVDRSCSMADEGRMAYTRRGMENMIDRLERGDRIDIVLFDDRACAPLENYVVGRDDPALLTEAIRRIEPRGATDLDLGLREGYRISTNHVDTHKRNRRVMVLTDAELNTGDVNPHTVSEIGKAYDNNGIRLTGIGVGTTFRDDVLDRLTEKGKGAYVFLGSEAVVDRVFGSGFDSLTRTIAHDVQFELDLPESLAMERFYGEEASTVAADIQPIHYYAGTSQVFLQDLSIRGGKAPASDPVKLTVRYRDAITGEPETRIFHTTIGKMLDTDPHNVDKARALMAWTDLLTAAAMGADPCGAPLETYATRASRLSDDAEIGFVNGLVTRQCGEFDLPAAVAAAPLKVRIDSDQPISHVALSCPGVSASEKLSGSDTIARFDAVAGTCEVTLGGLVDMRIEVEVPETGRDLRCTVRGGRVHCG